MRRRIDYIIMSELIWALRVIGPRRLLKLIRAQRLGWVGIISGFYTTRAMQVLFQVGFFDELRRDSPVDVAMFAKTNDLDAEILQALCDYLDALRILKREDAGYVLDSKGHLLTEYGRGWFFGVYGYEGVFHSLDKLLAKEKVYGRDITKRVDFVARGSEEMENWIYFPLAIDMIRSNKFSKVLDLGCGEATFLTSLCEAISSVDGYGIDIEPGPVTVGREKIARAGLQNRVSLHVGDFTCLDNIPIQWQDIDVMTAFFVLHEILYRGADYLVTVLGKFRTRFPGVPLIVLDVIKPASEELRRRPGMAAQYILHHELTHQKLTSIDEWQNLFQSAGFASIEMQYASFARTAIFTLA